MKIQYLGRVFLFTTDELIAIAAALDTAIDSKPSSRYIKLWKEMERTLHSHGYSSFAN